MYKIRLGDIFDLINPLQVNYRLLFVGGNGCIFVKYYDLTKYSDYYSLKPRLHQKNFHLDNNQALHQRR